MRLIDADALIETIDREYPHLDRQDMKQWIYKAPTIIVDENNSQIADIKTEIEQIVDEEAATLDESWWSGLLYALTIIDKHTKDS